MALANRPVRRGSPLPVAARRAVFLTWVGLWAERILQAFWPLLSLLAAFIGILLFGWDSDVAIELWWSAATLGAVAIVLALGLGISVFQRPRRQEALARVDQVLAGRPLAALEDEQALGNDDPVGAAFWQAHRARMAKVAETAENARPDLQISRKDPYALRHLATLILVSALIFGGLFRLEKQAAIPLDQAAQTLAPSFEGWIDPPPYTGKPGLYLGEIKPGAFSVPQGSRLTLRLYGDTLPSVVQNLGDNPSGASAAEQEIVITKSGELMVGTTSWRVSVIADAPPSIKLVGEPERMAEGEMRQAFAASDDYGVTSVAAEIELDLSRVERRHGLVLGPEMVEPIRIDIPLPVTGKRSAIEGKMAEDFSKHPFVGLPVRLVMLARDEAGQEARSVVAEVHLEGRRFFDPLAAAVAEQRRDLLWNRENAKRVAQVLRASSFEAQDLTPSASVYLRLKQVISRLEDEMKAGPLATEARDEIAEILWEIAIDIEEGALSGALARLQKAEEKLAEALKRGASPDEIAKLTEEMRQAMNDYMKQLAQEGSEPGPQMSENTRTITQSELDQMMKQLQELMEQGKTAEAQALLDELMQMMENMQVTEGGPGQDGEGNGAMQGLNETLKDQQDLSDQTFQDLQDQARRGQNGNRPGEGEPQGEPNEGDGTGEGANPNPGESQDQSGMGGEALAERQESLRRMLREQEDRLPGLGSEEGEALKRRLGEAGEAMDQAEEDLRNDDLAGALENQADAMQALREGLRDLGEMLAQENNGDGRQGDADGQADAAGERDPLGRDNGTTGRIGTDQRLLQGEDIYRRSRELLDEIRRRSGEKARPDQELDYLRRLIDRF